MANEYIARQSPHDKLWYALGHCGDNQWLPISGGYRHKAEAQTHARHQPRIDAAAQQEVVGAESILNQLD